MRERVRLVFEQTPSHESQWAAIVSVASKFACVPQMLRKWVRQEEHNAGTRAGLKSPAMAA